MYIVDYQLEHGRYPFLREYKFVARQRASITSRELKAAGYLTKTAFKVIDGKALMELRPSKKGLELIKTF